MEGRNVSCGFPASITYCQKTVDYLVPRHPGPIILDGYLAHLFVELHVHISGIRIPRIGDDFGQHCRYGAVKVDSQMFKHAQIDLHLKGTGHDGHPPDVRRSRVLWHAPEQRERHFLSFAPIA